MDLTYQQKEHSYNNRNLYYIEQIRDLEPEKNITGKKFEVVIRYYESFSEKSMKERVLMDSLRPFFPHKFAKGLLKHHADHLKKYIYPPDVKIRHSFEDGAKKLLNILKEFCGHYKYCFKEVFGQEQGNHS
jgi:hypothetical protein